MLMNKTRKVSENLYIGESNGEALGIEALGILEENFDVVIQMGKADPSERMSNKLIVAINELRAKNADEVKLQEVTMGSPFQQVERIKDEKKGIVKSVSYKKIGEHSRDIPDSFIRHNYNTSETRAIYYVHFATSEELLSNPERLYKLWLFSHHLKVCVLYENPLVNNIGDDHQSRVRHYAPANAAKALVAFFNVFSKAVNNEFLFEMNNNQLNDNEVLAKLQGIQDQASSNIEKQRLETLGKLNLRELDDVGKLGNFVGTFLAYTSWHDDMVISTSTYDGALAYLDDVKKLYGALITPFKQRYINNKASKGLVRAELNTLLTVEISRYEDGNQDASAKQIKLYLLKKIQDIFRSVQALGAVDSRAKVIKLGLVIEMVLSHPASWADARKFLGKKIPSNPEGGDFIRMLKAHMTLFMRDLQTDIAPLLLLQPSNSMSARSNDNSSSAASNASSSSSEARSSSTSARRNAVNAEYGGVFFGPAGNNNAGIVASLGSRAAAEEETNYGSIPVGAESANASTSQPQPSGSASATAISSPRPLTVYGGIQPDDGIDQDDAAVANQDNNAAASVAPGMGNS
jgi:hypothetical protein